MRISVIIPLYNRESLISTVLDSVLSQTALQHICEIIVVDDGSRDSSSLIVRDYISSHDTVPIVLISQTNQGVAAARNTGIQLARGDWIAFLDDDDIWLPNKIERQVEIISKHPEIDFLGCNHNGKPLRILWRKIESLYSVKLHDLCIKSFPVTPSILVRKSVVMNVGCFDESMQHMEDAYLCLMICSRFNYYHLPESLVEIDIDKKYYASSGLSSDLKAMHDGEIINAKRLRKNGYISRVFYLFLRCFYALKYLRRIIIRKINVMT